MYCFSAMIPILTIKFGFVKHLIIMFEGSLLKISVSALALKIKHWLGSSIYIYMYSYLILFSFKSIQLMKCYEVSEIHFAQFCPDLHIAPEVKHKTASCQSNDLH